MHDLIDRLPHNLLAVIALVVSGLAYWRTTRNDRRDLFLKVHEQLLQSDLVDGRQVLYGLTSVTDVDDLTRADRTLLFRLFAMYDLMGMYVRRGWIEERTALSEWGDSLVRSRAPGAHWVEYRRRVTNVVYPHWEVLSEVAADGPPRGAGARLHRRWRRYLWRRSG